MRHEKFPKAAPRPITSRRLKASERALKREQDRHPLFAEQVAEEQPSALGRLEQIEDSGTAQWRQMRRHVAETWNAARRILHSLPEEQQADLLRQWNAGPWPPSSAYFADFLYRKTGRSSSRERAEFRLEKGTLPGEEVCRLMRVHRVRIRDLALRTGITMKRIREVRETGLSDRNAIRDWIQAISETDPGPV